MFDFDMNSPGGQPMSCPFRPTPRLYDLAVIGGGINGVGIAADAAGRGLSVFLCEKDDLASHTSSASSKLIHGGLRYLEHYEFRLVREALAEREVLLAKARTSSSQCASCCRTARTCARPG
jgi:glycerol-3-phosphate dehydrogenase